MRAILYYLGPMLEPLILCGARFYYAHAGYYLTQFFLSKSGSASCVAEALWNSWMHTAVPGFMESFIQRTSLRILVAKLRPALLTPSFREVFFSCFRP